MNYRVHLLSNEINIARDKLLVAGEKVAALSDPEVVEISQELDTLIMEYQLLMIRDEN